MTEIQRKNKKLVIRIKNRSCLPLGDKMNKNRKEKYKKLSLQVRPAKVQKQNTS